MHHYKKPYLLHIKYNDVIASVISMNIVIMLYSGVLALPKYFFWLLFLYFIPAIFACTALKALNCPLSLST